VGAGVSLFSSFFADFLHFLHQASPRGGHATVAQGGFGDKLRDEVREWVGAWFLEGD
jgi:hypothetical protein